MPKAAQLTKTLFKGLADTQKPEIPGLSTRCRHKYGKMEDFLDKSHSTDSSHNIFFVTWCEDLPSEMQNVLGKFHSIWPILKIGSGEIKMADTICIGNVTNEEENISCSMPNISNEYSTDSFIGLD